MIHDLCSMWLLGEFYIVFAELIDIKEVIFTSPGVCEGSPKKIFFSLFVPLVFFKFLTICSFKQCI